MSGKEQDRVRTTAAISRRKVFKAAAGLGAVLANPVMARAAAGGGTPPILLIHGAWHGAWCWRKVTPKLEAAGHRIVAPTMTGLGQRAHLASPIVDAEVHVRDIENALFYEDLQDVVVVAHSYGGIPATAAVSRHKDRVRKLVYLDAFVPQSGESLFDLVVPKARTYFKKRATDLGGGWLVPPQPIGGYGVTDKADRAWAEPRLTAQPIRTLSEGAQFAALGDLPRTYIRTAFANASFDGFAKKAQERDWGFHKLDCGHDAMIILPDQVADLILSEAKAS